MERRRWIWGGALAGLLLAGAAVVNLVRPSLGEYVGQFDMAGMLREIHQINSAIGETNEAIGITLNQVQQQSTKVANVHQRLLHLEDGLGSQVQVLERMASGVREQADLSWALAELTASIQPSTTGLIDTATLEAAAVERMDVATSQLAALMSEIEQSNRSVKRKLVRAEQLSAAVLQQMP